MTMATNNNEGEVPRKASAPAKAKQQLYKGEWTEAEKAYLRCLIEDFDYGILDDVSDGQTKRKYLAKMLSCEPKRISKLLECSEYNGRANYQNQKDEIGDPNLIQRRRYHRLQLEAEFRRSREDLLHRRKSAFIYSRAKRSARWNPKPTPETTKRAAADPPTADHSMHLPLPPSPAAIGAAQQSSSSHSEGMAFLPPGMAKAGGLGEGSSGSVVLPGVSSVAAARLSSSPSMSSATATTTNPPLADQHANLADPTTLEAAAAATTTGQLDPLSLARLRAASLQLQHGNTLSNASAGALFHPSNAGGAAAALAGGISGGLFGDNSAAAVVGGGGLMGSQGFLANQLLLQQLQQQQQQQQLALTLAMAPTGAAHLLTTQNAPAAGFSSSGIPSSLIMGQPFGATAAAPIGLQNLALLGGGGGGVAAPATVASSSAHPNANSAATAATAAAPAVPTTLVDQLLLQQQQQQQQQQQHTATSSLPPSLLYNPVTHQQGAAAAPPGTDSDNKPKKPQLQP